MTFMQISKVSPGSGSVTSLVEMIPGAQQPIYTDDDLLRRSQVSGNMKVGQGRVYLKVVISQPNRSDVGEYRCHMTYLGDRHELGRLSDTKTLVAV